MPEQSSNERFQFSERDLLIKVMGELKALRDETRAVANAVNVEIKDHEARLRVLENFRWYIIGAAGTSGFVGALLGRAIWH